MQLVAIDAPPAEPEETLCARAKAGDRAAFGELVARHTRRVVVALLAEGQSLDAAKELAQEAWARLWEQRGQLARLTLPGLAVTQAQFLARDAARRARVAPTVAGEADAAAPAPLADARLTSAQALARVSAKLATLSPRQREVFRLANAEGLPHAEVARRVGLSLQRVRQIVWEVRTLLRAALEESP